MAWTIDFTESAKKSLKSLDRVARERVVSFLEKRVASLDDPRELEKALQGRLRQYWSYRVGDYRIVCDVQDAIVTILVVDVDHRKEVYKSN